MDRDELIQEIIDENRFETRGQNCPGTKCHKHLDEHELICLLCVCPEYDRSKDEGGCKINNHLAGWFYHKKGKIWDCTNCGLPHAEVYVRKYLNELSFQELQEISQCRTIQDLWKFYGRI